MSDDNDKPKIDDWGMTMPHLRIDNENSANDFSDEFPPASPHSVNQPPTEDWGITQQNFNLPNNQTPTADFDKTAPNINIPNDVWQNENPSPNQSPADDWEMNVPNINQPNRENHTDWSMPAPIFRKSEGENLDDVAKRTVTFNLHEADNFDKTAPNFNFSEVAPPESFAQTAPNINLPEQSIVPESLPVNQIAEQNNPPAKVQSSKIVFIGGGLFAMLLFAGVVLIGIYFLFLKPATAAKKIEPVQQEQNETITSPAPVAAPQNALPREIEYKGAMVFVSAGEFTMGSDTDADESKPAHKVVLPAYYIDKTEVTNGEYKAFCDATGKSYPPNPHLEADYFTNRPNAPVVGVSFADAKAYANWAGKRLPTEEEWEKAASWDEAAQSKREFPWGNTFQKNNVAFGTAKISDVGKFPGGASPFGAMDMAGNVLEWVDAFFQPYPNSIASNAEFGEKNRVVRGGHFGSKSIDSLKTTKRIYVAPETTSGEDDEKLVAAIIGFRCAISADDSRLAETLKTQGK